mmetsp:Transcript_35632/g.101533  ORF Transcript_35632/g.101533 Transcript_35632/m.101533 type:complete len:239 (+) Transcript_35632:754-1470(+)
MPFRKNTSSASAMPSITVPLPMEPPLTTLSTLRNIAPFNASINVDTTCCAFVLEALLAILLCNATYCALSVEAKFCFGPSTGACTTFAGGGGVSPGGSARSPLGGVPGRSVFGAAVAGVGEATPLSCTTHRFFTTKRSFSFTKNSTGLTPAMLAKLMLNFAANFPHKSLISIDPLLVAFKMLSTSAARENGFSPVSSRMRATWLFSTWKPFCLLKKSWSFSPARPRVCRACVTLAPNL